MKSTLNLSLVAIFVCLAIACYVEFADAECCYVPFDCTVAEKKTHRCADCTEATIYCGLGKCNVFGCNCDGGCRKGNESMWCWNPNNCHHRASRPVITLVKLYDTDSDSALSLEEFSALFENHFDGDSHQEFQALDVNSDGYVSYSEIDRDF